MLEHKKESNPYIKSAEELRDDTGKREWKKRSDSTHEMSVKSAGFQTVGIVISKMFEPLNFEKGFKLEIWYDPEDEAGNVNFKYYE